MSDEWDKVIDRVVYQVALELSFRAGEECRKDMLKSGMTEQEADDIIKRAFDWRYENKA